MEQNITIVKEFKSAMADAQLGDNDIAYVTLSTSVADLPEAKEFLHLFKSNFGDKAPVKLMVNARKLRKTTKEVRDFFGDTSIAEIFGPGAFVVGSGLSKVAINLFLKFSKPAFPTKAFTNDEKAMEWLKNQ